MMASIFPVISVDSSASFLIKIFSFNKEYRMSLYAWSKDVSDLEAAADGTLYFYCIIPGFFLFHVNGNTGNCDKKIAVAMIIVIVLLPGLRYSYQQHFKKNNAKL